MTLNPYVRPLTTSVCQATFWFSNDIRKCVLFFFSSGWGAQSWEHWQGEEGDSRGIQEKRKKRKAQDEEQWKGRCSNVLVVSQLRVHALITDVVWGEWRTNLGSRARWGAARDEVSVNLQPQTITGLMSTDVDPLLVETSPGVCLGFSW